MNRSSLIFRKPQASLAVFLTVLLNGCATSGSPVAIAPQLPDIPPALESECVDPGVGPVTSVGEAVAAVGQNRVYAACNKRKHRDMKGFYRGVQRGFGGGGG